AVSSLSCRSASRPKPNRLRAAHSQRADIAREGGLGLPLFCLLLCSPALLPGIGTYLPLVYVAQRGQHCLAVAFRRRAFPDLRQRPVGTDDEGGPGHPDRLSAVEGLLAPGAVLGCYGCAFVDEQWEWQAVLLAELAVGLRTVDRHSQDDRTLGA